jgi:hypothetical protein
MADEYENAGTTVVDAEKPKMGGEMPPGQRPLGEIRQEDVEITAGGVEEPVYSDDAVAELVWKNYNLGKNYLEQNSWLLDWQAIDYYYQNQNNDRWLRPADGRPVRIARYIIAKNANTMDNQVHRGIWSNQKSFALQPEGATTELMLEAWTHLLWILMKRAKAEYNFGLAGECSRLFGTGILKPGWEERTVVRKRRRRKVAEPKITLPVTGETSIPTEKSDAFEEVKEDAKESWPFIEFRKLGYTFFDPKWCTPNAPEESAGYVIDVDYLSFQDLQQLRELSCYKNLPDDEELKEFFFVNPQLEAPAASAVAQSMEQQSSLAMHAEGEERKTSASPLDGEGMIVTMWTAERAQAILCFNDRKITIRNDAHEMGDHALHYAFNWWNMPNSGYGMGIGKINLDDQRMETGVLNEVLKMIGMWFNTPLMIPRGMTTPTQNVVAGLGTFWQVDAPGGDVTKAARYAEKPIIPPDAWRVLDMALHGGEDVVGANSTTMQGNLGGPGSSAMRTAAGVNRVGGKADENVSKPVLYESWALERFIYFLIEMVRLKMPLAEIREILAKKFAKAIIDEIDFDQFLNAEFTVNVLAGQKMSAKAAILQLIPFLLQILQQPQLLDALHQTGRTIDFEAIEALFIRMSELDGNADNIFRAMTARERVTYKQQNPAAQKVQGELAVETQRGKNKIAEQQVRSQGDLTTKLATVAAERAAGSVELERAEGLLERNEDEGYLRSGVPGMEG